jgi:hypothetical protein
MLRIVPSSPIEQSDADQPFSLAKSEFSCNKNAAAVDGHDTIKLLADRTHFSHGSDVPLLMRLFHVSAT